MGVVAGVAALAGLALSAYGQYKQSQDAASQADQNAQLADAQAAGAYQRGAQVIGQLRMRGAQMLGAQKAAYAGSGVDVTQGTPLQTFKQTQFMEDLDVATARNNAAREAWGYKVEGGNYSNQAGALRSNAAFGLGASILGGVGEIASYGGRYAANATPGAAAPTYRTPAGAGDYSGGLGRGVA